MYRWLIRETGEMYLCWRWRQRRVRNCEKAWDEAVQAVWYLQEGTTQPCKRKYDFIQLENPLEVLIFCEYVGY